MKFASPLIEGIILKRYKRFLSEVKIPGGEIVTAHVANTGSMATCWEEGWKVLLSIHDNPKRKLKYSLEMTSNGETWIGVNTYLTNRLVKEAIENGWAVELSGYSEVTPEVTVGESRLDFLLSGGDRVKCYVEVKNVTLRSDGREAAFPDAVSVRGQKHLRQLIKLKEGGHRAVMFYVVQREDVNSFSTTGGCDPEYSRLLGEAVKAGVEILVYRCLLSKTEIRIDRKIPLKGLS